MRRGMGTTVERDQSLPLLNHVAATNDLIGYYHLTDMHMRMRKPPPPLKREGRVNFSIREGRANISRRGGRTLARGVRTLT